MKNYRVTVNGNMYEVSVEEVSAGSSNTASESVNISNSAPIRPATEPKINTVSSNNGVKVTAPMPGIVLDIKVSVGQQVSKNDVVIILEAMKMENEIVSPTSGKVASINVNKSASVNSGDVLIVIEE